MAPETRDHGDPPPSNHFTPIRSLMQDRLAFGPDTGVRLIRSLTNAVYAIDDPHVGRSVVLKIYGLGWRSAADVRWEVDLLDHLRDREILVAPVIRARDGSAVQSIRLDGVDRVAVLSGLLPGRKPPPPFTPELYEREGQAVARLHAALDDLRSAHPRPGLDLQLLVAEPVRLALERLDRDDGARLLAVARRIEDRIATLAARGLDRGPCHGDVTFDNIHLTVDGQFGWLDFDSGGPGWRAIDLQGWAALEADTTALGAAFHAGYQSARPLPDADWAAAPWLSLAQDVWSIGVELRMRPERQDPEPTVEWLRVTTRTLADRVDRLSGERD